MIEACEVGVPAVSAVVELFFVELHSIFTNGSMAREGLDEVGSEEGQVFASSEPWATPFVGGGFRECDGLLGTVELVDGLPAGGVLICLVFEVGVPLL